MNRITLHLSRRVTTSKGRFFTASAIEDNDVVCVGLARTPVGKFGGALSKLSAPKLGSHVIKHAIARSGLPSTMIQEAFIGNVCSAGIGQAPARQAVLGAGLHVDVPSTTVNKVCASGMKTVMMAAMSISSGYRSAMIAGGMESMSNIPYYLPGSRTGYRLGNNQVVDGMVHDGLWDIYNNQHMGMCGEACAESFKFSRQDQDDYAVRSYQRASDAWKANVFADEIAPIEISGGRGKPSTEFAVDEEFTNINVDKIPTLKPAFKKDGTVTAANASTLNDGATAFTLVSGKVAKEMGLKPLFKIRGYGDAARDPVEFTIAPAYSIPRAIEMAGLKADDIDYYEINEAFSVANIKLLNLNPDCVNIYGGAVALGHALGSSGARILATLYTVLKNKDAKYGCASICNGGGGASAIVIERVN
jgi:acetyl-CoA C-acetyltransferase